jgi:TPR repeat protein
MHALVVRPVSIARLLVGGLALTVALVLLLTWPHAASAATDPVRAKVERANKLHEAGQYTQALALFQEAAQQGDSHAMFYIGWMTRAGQGGRADGPYARRWFEEAALRGSRGAMRELGRMNLEGSGGPRNAEIAVKWLGEAIRRDDLDAMEILAIAYYQGSIGRTDYGLAMKWFRYLAGRGVSNAMNWMGVMYAEGAGVPQDNCQAADWYRRAVKADSAGATPARFNLGRFHQFGLCMPVDLAKARELFQTALRFGDEDSKEALASLDRGPALSGSGREETRYEKRPDYWMIERYTPPPPPPPTYVPPISPFYGQPCWGC